MSAGTRRRLPAPAWAGRLEAERDGLTWHRLSSVRVMCQGPAAGRSDLLEVALFRDDRIEQAGGEWVAREGELTIAVGAEFFELAEAERLVEALQELLGVAAGQAEGGDR